MKNLKNWRTYSILCFLEVMLRINNVALFVVPFQAITAVAQGKMPKRLKGLFKSLDLINIPTPNNDNLYQYFVVMIIIIFLSFFIFRKIRSSFLIRIKRRAVNRIRRENLEKNISIISINKEFKEIESFSKLIGEILFSSTLITFIFIYDFQLALIIAGAVYLYWQGSIFLEKRNFNKQEVSDKDEDEEEEFFEDYYDNEIVTNKDKNKKDLNKDIEKLFKQKDILSPEVLKRTIETLAMLSILTNVYFRSNPGMNIIVIFLVRRYLGVAFSSIRVIVRKTIKK